MPLEIGESAAQILRRISAEFDPNSVVNPQVLYTE